MRTRALSLVGLLALAACGQTQQPCSGSSCLSVAGNYTFVLGEGIGCSVWEKNASPTSLMQVTQGATASQLSITLWPVTDDPHYLTGTLYTNGSMTVSESQQSTLLQIPWATITGSFTSQGGQSGGAPYLFSGQLLLQGGSTQSTTAGGTGGLACQGTTTFKAVESATSSLDAGTDVPDGGDAGS